MDLFWIYVLCDAAAVALDSNPVKITPIWREDTIPILPNWLLVFHGHEEPIPSLRTKLRYLILIG